MISITITCSVPLLAFSLNNINDATNSIVTTDETGELVNANGDSLSNVLNNINADPGTTNWDFIPAKQYKHKLHHKSHAAGCFYQSDHTSIKLITFIIKNKHYGPRN